MSEPLSDLLGERVEVEVVGGMSYHGELVEIGDVWLKLKDASGTVYVNKAHVVAVRKLPPILVDIKWLAPSSEGSGEKGKSKNKNKK